LNLDQIQEFIGVFQKNYQIQDGEDLAVQLKTSTILVGCPSHRYLRGQ